MKRTILLLAAFGLTLPLGADVIVQYGTAGSMTSLPAFSSTTEVTPTDLVAGPGLLVQNFSTFNFQEWDTASTSFADAVAADDKWTWGFMVDSAGVDLTTMDIRVDRSGSGPDDFEIQAVVTPSGGAPGAPISLLTHDFGDSSSGVPFEDVDLTAIPSLGVGDSIEFTLAAFNSESSNGSFDLETITFPGGNDGIVINGDIVGALPRLSLTLDRTVAFENEEGTLAFLALVTRSGDTTDALTVTVTNPDPSELDVAASLDILGGESEALLFFDVKDDADQDGAQMVTLEFSAPGYESAMVDITVLDDDSTTDDIVLNEALINTTGTDTEFLELYNNTGATVDIQGWTVVSYDSDTGEAGAEVASVMIPSGAPVNLASGGFYLIGDDAFVAAFPDATPDLQVRAFGTPPGSQTLAVFDAAGNPVYSVLFDDGDGEANLGGAPITPDLTVGPDGTFIPAGFRLVADGGGVAELLEFAPVPAASASPGETNVLPSELLITLSPAAVNELDGALASVGTVTRTRSETSVPLTVTLSDDDLDDSEITIPASVTILAGDASATFDIGALDDAVEDGPQSITITATAAGFVDGTAVMTVGDDESSFPMVVINEVWADDTGGDTAEYVELFGPAGASLAGLSLIVVDGDTSGNTTTSTNYRRVTQQVEFSSETIPGDGYFVIGAGTTPDVDLSVSINWLQNGSQTYAIVPTVDIAFDATDTDELTQASVDAITANLIDAIGVVDGGGGDASYFGAPELAGNIDLIARNGDGVDTDTIDDWNTQANGSVELGDAGDALSSPGTTNIVSAPSMGVLIVASAFNFTTNEVTLTISGMDADTGLYSLQSSTDLDQADAWGFVGDVFFVGQPNVVETGPDTGIYDVTIPDPELGSESVNFYRVIEE